MGAPTTRLKNRLKALAEAKPLSKPEVYLLFKKPKNKLK